MEIKGALTLAHSDLPKKRINTLGITHKSVVSCWRKAFGYNEDVKNISFTKAEIDEAQVASWSLIPLAELRKKPKN